MLHRLTGRSRRQVQVMTDTERTSEGRLLSDFEGRSITLFPDRVEYTKKAFWSVQRGSIMLSRIIAVTVDYVDGFTKGKGYVSLETSDGKKHHLGLTTNAPEVHEALYAAP